MRKIPQHPVSPTKEDGEDLFNSNQTAMAAFISKDFIESVNELASDVNNMADDYQLNSDGSNNLLEKKDSSALIPSITNPDYNTKLYDIGAIRYNKELDILEVYKYNGYDNWRHIYGDYFLTNAMVSRIYGANKKFEFKLLTDMANTGSNLNADINFFNGATSDITLFQKAQGIVSTIMTSIKFSAYGVVLSGTDENLILTSAIGSSTASLDHLQAGPYHISVNDERGAVRGKTMGHIDVVYSGVTIATIQPYETKRVNIQMPTGTTIVPSADFTGNVVIHDAMDEFYPPSLFSIGLRTTGNTEAIKNDNLRVKTDVIGNNANAVTLSAEFTYSSCCVDNSLNIHLMTLSDIVYDPNTNNGLTSVDYGISFVIMGDGRLKLSYKRNYYNLIVQYFDVPYSFENGKTFKFTVRVSQSTLSLQDLNLDIFIDGEKCGIYHVRDIETSNNNPMYINNVLYFTPTLQLDGTMQGSYKNTGIAVRNVKGWDKGLSNNEIRVL